MIADNTIYVLNGLKQYDAELYDKTIFKAISEAILGFDDEFDCISNAFLEMMAEKIFNMDVNGSRIIMPRTEHYVVGEQILDLRVGYERYTLTLNLIVNGSFDEEWSELLSDSQVKFLFQMLEAISLMEKKRCISNAVNPKEFEYIEKYQTIINEMFTELDHNYFAFCALITTDDLRSKCMSKFNTEGQSEM